MPGSQDVARFAATQRQMAPRFNPRGHAPTRGACVVRGHPGRDRLEACPRDAASAIAVAPAAMLEGTVPLGLGAALVASAAVLAAIVAPAVTDVLRRVAAPAMRL